MSRIITGVKTSRALAFGAMTNRSTWNHRWIALATLVACGCAHPSPTSTPRSSTMSDQNRDENKRSVETLFDGCFNRGDLALLDRLVAPDYAGPQGSKGPDGFRAVVVLLRTGFPDIHYTLDDVIAEGERVAVRWHWTGTNSG